ncbi:ORF107 [White spot syndrome virus]|uniref:ORF107 n=1 Tax=White spot syndrome virus TaxID=342409 RepID=A0A2D3I5Z9_9VIRU|nr:ORF107 [White spot syndrome virus]
MSIFSITSYKSSSFAARFLFLDGELISATNFSTSSSSNIPPSWCSRIIFVKALLTCPPTFSESMSTCLAFKQYEANSSIAYF